MGAENTLPWLVVLILGLTTAISVAISFYLYRWRRILINDQRVLVPEEIVARLHNVQKEVNGLRGVTNDAVDEQRTNITHVAEELRKLGRGATQLLDTTLNLQQALDERDAEIRRLREGYDRDVFRRFLGRFLRAKQALDDWKRTPGGSSEKLLDQVSRLLEDAFEECGVEEFSPPIGSDYRTASGVADNPNAVKTNNPQEAFQIADVIQPGYRFRNSETGVLIQARVSVFILQGAGA
jgi:molecular chaperone GrpE (heat shock protein)